MPDRNLLLSRFFLFSVFSLYYASFCMYGFNFWDEGGIYYGGIRYLRGESVITDFFGYAAGRYLIVEAVYRLFGQEMINVRYVFALLSASLPFLAFMIARRIMPLPFAVAAAVLVLSAPAVYYQRFYGFVYLFNAFAFMLFLEDKKQFPWVIIGGLFAYYLKVETLIFLIPLYIFLAWRVTEGRGRALKVLAIATTFIVVYINSKYYEFVYFRVVNEIGLWSNSFPSLFGSYQGREFGFIGFFENLLFYLPFITAILLGFISLRYFSKDHIKRDQLLILAYLQMAALALVVSRAGFDNLIRCLPLFFIVSPFLVHFLISRARPEAVQRFRRGAAEFLLAIYLYDFNFAHGFYAGSIGTVLRNRVKVESGLAKGVYTNKTDANIIFGLTKWIEQETDPGDPIFTVPLNPILYYLTDRVNPTRYDWLLPGTLRSQAEEMDVIKSLNSTRPKIIILVDIDIDNREERSLKRYVPSIVGWIVNNYSYSGRVAFFQVWRQKK